MLLKQKLIEVYQSMDASSDNEISMSEFEEFCKTLQIELNNEERNHFKKHFNLNNGMNFEGFYDFIKSRLQQIFHEIDKDNSGFIDVNEVDIALHRLNINLSKRQLNAILKSMDTNKDNAIDFDEFCIFFSDLPSPSLQAIATKWSSGYGLDVGTDVVPAALPPPEMPLLQFMTAGGLAGIASRTITAPLEKIKILTQIATQRLSFVSTMQNIVRNEGFKGLFGGNLTNCVRVFPTSALVCLVYSRMIKYTPVDNAKNPNQALWRFFSGACAGLIATSVTHPIDVVRARLTVQNIALNSTPVYTGILQSIRQIHATEGMRGIYKGLSPSLISIAPFLGAQQCIYDVLKLHVANSSYGNSPSTFMLCGAVAGTCAQTLVHPLDVVRRHMQIKSSASSLKQLWSSGGLRSLYAGLFASYLKVIPAASTSLLVRDAILGRLNKE